jgi:hypothetical protein
MANVAPNAPVGLAAPTTFTELFQMMPDAYAGVYLNYLTEYMDPQKAPDELLRMSTAIFPADQVPAVFIFQDNHRKIRAIHHLHQITRPIGQAPGPWDNVCIGFTTDIHEGHITTVRLPTNEVFTAVGPCEVPTVATMPAQLANANADGTIRPVVAGNDTEQVTTRRTLPIPYPYIMQFLFRSLTPTEAWNQIGTQIIADGREQDCLALLNFLRVAVVDTLAQVRNAPDTLPASCLIADVVPPEGDPQYFSHLTRKLRVLLPGGTMAPTPTAVLQQVMHGQNALQQTLREAALDNRAARLQEQETANAPKTFSEVFPAHSSKVRALCEAGDDDEALPEFWRLLAQAGGKKSVGFNLFQEMLTARACDPASAKVQNVVLPSLYEQVQKFQIGSTDQEDLKRGISPFLMCPVGYPRSASQRQINDQYLMINDGSTPLLSDTVQLLPSSYNIPINLYSLVDFIGAYSIVLDVLLGINHPLSTRMREHHTFWYANNPMVINALLPDNYILASVNTLRYIQMTCITYFNEKMYMEQATFPNLDFLEQQVRYRTFHTLPPMPAEYYYQQASQMAKATPTPSVAHSISQSTVQSTLSGLTVGTGTRTGGRTSGTQINAPEAQHNPAWAERLTATKKSLASLRQAGGKPPKSTDGSSHLCLSWHMKGFCMDNCGSITTHRPLDASERASIQAYVDKHLAPIPT